MAGSPDHGADGSATGYSLGVDLGTTFVAAAVAREDQVTMVPLGDRSVVMPSVVYARNDGVLLAGGPAARRMVSSPDRVAAEMKRRLGDPTPLILGGTAYSVTHLLGTLLRDVLERVTAQEGAPPERVMLTHPATWGTYQRKLFAEVARFAGVQQVQTITEPEAAAAHFAATHPLAVGEAIAVYDLGGGTFDATVLGRTDNGIEVLGTPQGIERLGGADLDDAILSLVNHATGGALIALDRGDPNTVAALARLRQDCVLAKEALSSELEATIPVFLPGRHQQVELGRQQFEAMIRAPLEATVAALGQALQSASIAPCRVSTVLLVGGSSHIPLVRRLVEEQLGCRTVVDAHPKHAVALGAASLSRSAQGADAGPAPGAGVPAASARLSGLRRHRRGIAAAAGLLLLAGAGSGLGASLSQHPAAGQPRTVAAPSSPGPGIAPAATRATAALPADMPGLIAAITADETLAGAHTQPLRGQLEAVTAGVGEARRQAALAALGTVAGGGVEGQLASAVNTALAPYTVLNTPADMIADLRPNPALAGPKADLLLGCMQEFLGRTPQQQQQESQQILAALPAWSADGGLRADLVDATVRMVMPVAQGQRTFNDGEAFGGTPPAPGGS